MLGFLVFAIIMVSRKIEVRIKHLSKPPLTTRTVHNNAERLILINLSSCVGHTEITNQLLFAVTIFQCE